MEILNETQNFCPECGNKLNDDEFICTNCGHVIDEDKLKIRDQEALKEFEKIISNSSDLKFYELLADYGIEDYGSFIEESLKNDIKRSHIHPKDIKYRLKFYIEEAANKEKIKRINEKKSLMKSLIQSLNESNLNTKSKNDIESLILHEEILTFDDLNKEIESQRNLDKELKVNLFKYLSSLNLSKENEDKIKILIDRGDIRSSVQITDEINNQKKIEESIKLKNDLIKHLKESKLDSYSMKKLENRININYIKSIPQLDNEIKRIKNTPENLSEKDYNSIKYDSKYKPKEDVIKKVINDKNKIITKYLGSTFKSLLSFKTVETEEMKDALMSAFSFKKSVTYDEVELKFNEIFKRKYNSIQPSKKIELLRDYYTFNEEEINRNLSKNYGTYASAIFEIIGEEENILKYGFEVKARFDFYAKGKKKQYICGEEYINGLHITDDVKSLINNGLRCVICNDPGLLEDGPEKACVVKFAPTVGSFSSKIRPTNYYAQSNDSFFVTFNENFINVEKEDGLQQNIYYDEIFCCIIGYNFLRISTIDNPNLLIVPNREESINYKVMLVIKDLLISKKLHVECLKHNLSRFSSDDYRNFIE